MARKKPKGGASLKRGSTKKASPVGGRAQPPEVDPEERPLESPTSVAAEAQRTGVLPDATPKREEQIPGRESETMRIGDPDVSALANEYSGEEAPGSSMPTPDQGQVDEIGRAYGIQEEDSGPLRPASEVLERRDRRRRSG